ncbi:hypothetical protein [Nostoc sp.]
MRFASFGLLSNTAALIIDAMIIAPLMLPKRKTEKLIADLKANGENE